MQIQNILGGVYTYWRQLEEGDAVSMHTSQSKCAWNKLVGAP
jgi:hypothetical protein